MLLIIIIIVMRPCSLMLNGQGLSDQSESPTNGIQAGQVYVEIGRTAAAALPSGYAKRTPSVVGIFGAGFR